MSLSPAVISVVKATAPVLAKRSVEVTSVFYSKMFKAHPELLNVFNDANQAQKKQPTALAHAVCAAAVHIDKLTDILPAIQPALHKHVALGVTPEQYDVVGKYLLIAVKEVLADDASDEVMDAWTKAYKVIADVFISLEKDLYAQTKANPGGWEGFVPFTVSAKKEDSEAGVCIDLKPKDGAKLPSYKAGQYITVRAKIPGQELVHNRHYSLCKKADGITFEIALKKEGKVSTWLKETVQIGDEVLLSAPAGPFAREVGAKRHIFIGSGSGITPFVAMAQEAIESKESVDLIYLIRSSKEILLLDEVKKLGNSGAQVKLLSSDESVVGATQDRFSADFLKSSGIVDSDAVYYLSGSEEFIRNGLQILKDAGIQESHIKEEVFGPALAL